MILPFLEEENAPKFSLQEDFDSINISGHKFLGSPLPSGIIVISKKYIESEEVEVVQNKDMTIGGSRNSISPVLVYEGIRKVGGKEGLRLKTKECLKKAEAIVTLFTQAEIKAWKNPYAITIVLERLPEAIMKKWHAPSWKKYTTLTALPKLTLAKAEAIISDVVHYRKTGLLNDDLRTLYPVPVPSLNSAPYSS